MKANETLEPVIRFPEFSAPWQTKAVDKVLKRRTAPVDVEPDTLYTQIGLRSHGKGIFHKEPVTGKNLGEKRVFWVQQNCLVMNIIFAWEQAVAKTSEREDGLIASHRFPMYEAKGKEADIDFFVRFFLRPRGKHLLGIASPGGAGRNRTLGQKEFDKLKVIVPSLPEQRKIADFLTAVDGRIVQLIQKKALLEDYKKGVMQQLFTQAIRFKDDHGNDFPEWEEKKLGEVAGEIKSGLSLDQNPARLGFKVTRIETISDRTINLEKVGYVQTERNIEDFRLLPGDILFSNINSVSHIGKVAFVDQDYDLYQGMNLLRIRAGKKCSATFLFQLLKSTPFVRYFQRICNQAVSQASINQTDLKKTPISLPSLGEQTKIAEFLSAIDRKIESVATQITETQTFKRGLLQQMFV